MQRHRVTACSCAAASALSMACGGVFTDVPPTFARVAPPPLQVDAVPNAATVVVVQASSPYDGGRQAVTFVRQDLEPVAQIVPRSYAIGYLPPGEHVLVAGVPALDAPDHCNWVFRQRFERGKVYVIDIASRDDFVPTTTTFSGTGAVVHGNHGTPDVGKVLSKLTHMAGDLPMAKREVRAQREFWSECVNAALRIERSLKGAQPPASAAADRGVQRLHIPPPP
jgi:hypothetical protein